MLHEFCDNGLLFSQFMELIWFKGGAIRLGKHLLALELLSNVRRRHANVYGDTLLGDEGDEEGIAGEDVLIGLWASLAHKADD